MQDMIDVIEEFSCPYQTQRYLAAYKEWRRKKKNRYAFRFSRNPKEAAFAENQSIVSETPAQAEQQVLTRLGRLIGLILLCYLLIENVLDKILVSVLHHMGMEIELVYFGESRLFGEERAVFWSTACVQLLKYLLPALVLWMILRMPLKISVPLRPTHSGQVVFGMVLMMLLSMGLGIVCVPRSAEMDKYRLIASAVGKEDHRIILYALFTIFIVPIATELLLHGCMFQVLRQFGDPFAIGTVSILAALMAHDLQDALRLGLVTVTISYFVMRSGSFLTAPILHIVHEIYMFALFYVETFGEMYSVQWWLTFLLPCLLGAVAGICLLLTKRLRHDQVNWSYTYLNTWDQATAFFTATPMVIFMIACVLLLVTNIMLE